MRTKGNTFLYREDDRLTSRSESYDERLLERVVNETEIVSVSV